MPQFQKTETVWAMANSSFSTVAKLNVAIKFLELDEQKTVNYTVHVATHKLTLYNMIIGHDLLNDLGLVLDYAKKLVFWGDHSCPMKTPQNIKETYINEVNTIIGTSSSRVSHILDVEYEKANLVEISRKNQNLTQKDQQKLLKLLLKYEPLFDGKLGHWKDANYDIELKIFSHIIPNPTQFHGFMKKL